MTVEDLLLNHDTTDHIWDISIYQCRKYLFYGDDLKDIPQDIREKKITKWSVVEGCDSCIHLVIHIGFKNEVKEVS